MTRLDDLLARHPLPTYRLAAWIAMVLVTVFVVWARLAELDEVSTAYGEVKPQGRVKVIQHLEGGVIESISVREGDRVAAGDGLLQLDLAVTGTNVQELRARLDGLLITRARLRAEADGRPPVFPDGPARRRPDVVAAETETLVARRREQALRRAALTETESQRRLDIEELLARRTALENKLAVARETFAMSQNLLASGLVAKMEHKALERDLRGLEGEYETLKPALPRARSALKEVRERLAESAERFRREALEELGKVELSIARHQELLREATERDRRTEIRSPTDGIVKNIRQTIGGVVRPGEPILEIVPVRENLVVEGRLHPADRGNVRESQTAEVKISAYDFTRYGALSGRVERISPDTTLDAEGRPYYRVVVRTERSYLGPEEGSLPISPGMEAQIDIKTGSRSLIDFLLKPVLRLQAEAFRER